MAWRSSGTNNAEMVDKLTRFGVISSDHIERAFRRVDRKFFVPRGSESIAHSDQPLKEGNVHISAPHIYASAMEALDLKPNSSLSFLNIGSGTGYISCIVAEILGPKSIHYGVEIHDDVIEHCKTSIAKWKTNSVEEQRDASTFHFMDTTPNIQVVKGNGLNIVNDKGESVVGFDRIYIGAAVDKEDFKNIVKLLSPGGILVGPVEDELVKVVRVGNISFELEEDMVDSRMDDEFISQILSGVRFAPLLHHPPRPTILPAHIWDPTMQHYYPSDHQRASMEVLLCSNSDVIQPLPPVPAKQDRINAAAMLPRGVWMEILSYTHRKWFEPEEDEVVYLKRRLREEKARAARAEQARREAEERCNEAEREKVMHRMLASRWHNRLNAMLSAQAQQHQGIQDIVESVNDIFSDGDGHIGSLAGLRALLQQHLHDDVHEEEDQQESDESVDDSEAEDMDHDMEEEVNSEEEADPHEDADSFNQFLETDQSETEFGSAVEVEAVSAAASLSHVESMGDSVMMDVESTKRRAYDQPRTVSISSDDL